MALFKADVFIKKFNGNGASGIDKIILQLNYVVQNLVCNALSTHHKHC